MIKEYTTYKTLDINNSEDLIVFLVDLYRKGGCFYYPTLKDEAFIKDISIKGSKYTFYISIKEGREDISTVYLHKDMHKNDVNTAFDYLKSGEPLRTTSKGRFVRVRRIERDGDFYAVERDYRLF